MGVPPGAARNKMYEVNFDADEIVEIPECCRRHVAPPGAPFPKLNISDEINLQPLSTKKGIINFWERGHAVLPHYLSAPEVASIRADLDEIGGKGSVIAGDVF
mgnify:CR=1 FL=1